MIQINANTSGCTQPLINKKPSPSSTSCSTLQQAPLLGYFYANYPRGMVSEIDCFSSMANDTFRLLYVVADSDFGSQKLEIGKRGNRNIKVDMKNPAKRSFRYLIQGCGKPRASRL
jgi:hypothetical protein